MYLSRLREIVDLNVIKKSGVKIAFDPMWGAARGYSDADIARIAGQNAIDLLRRTIG